MDDQAISISGFQIMERIFFIKTLINTWRNVCYRVDVPFCITVGQVMYR